MDLLVPTETETRCPHKGVASFYPVRTAIGDHGVDAGSGARRCEPALGTAPAKRVGSWRD
jgi:hypothetical protein